MHPNPSALPGIFDSRWKNPTVSVCIILLLTKKMMSFVLVAAVLCAFISEASSFRVAPSMRMIKSSKLSMSVFDKAVDDWAAQYPTAYAVGWGPTTKAERWNGRHAMFGWIALITTAYAKGHGLIPNVLPLFYVKNNSSIREFINLQQIL